MKCQHCGVNFDDNEKVCPMCGARAGSRGRMSEPKKPAWSGKPRETYTGYPPTIANDSEAKPLRDSAKTIRDTAKTLRDSTKPARNKRAKGDKKGALIVIGVIVLLQFLPVLASGIMNAIDHISNLTSGLQTNTPEYAYEWFNLYDILGENVATTLLNGDSIAFSCASDSTDYTFSYMTAAGGVYTNTGTDWCSYEDDADYYPSEYPYQQYAQYTACLTPNETQTTGAVPAWCEDTTDIWLTIYVDRDTNVITMEDMDGIGIFGDENTVPLYHKADMSAL